MKLIFLSALVLLTLVSCDSDSVAKKESCYFNDVQVSCDQLRGNSDPKPTAQRFFLEASGSGRYKIDNGVLTFLSPIVKTTSKILDGSNYNCSINIPQGAKFAIDVDERQLSLSDNKDKVSYERISSMDELNYDHLEWGSFEHNDSANDIKDYIKFNSNWIIEIKVLCYFSK